jgi:hypothetical protein
MAFVVLTFISFSLATVGPLLLPAGKVFAWADPEIAACDEERLGTAEDLDPEPCLGLANCGLGGGEKSGDCYDKLPSCSGTCAGKRKCHPKEYYTQWLKKCDSSDSDGYKWVEAPSACTC